MLLKKTVIIRFKDMNAISIAAGPIIIPVETAARELDAKLLFAAIAASKGATVILGRRRELNMVLHTFPPGIYMAHNFDKKRRRILMIARKLGHRIIAWDEEGLVWRSQKVYCTRRVSLQTINLLDAIIAWGDQQKNALIGCGVRNIPIFSVGNPRSDILRKKFWSLYDDKVVKIKEKYGDFILINSIFGWINHFNYYNNVDNLNDNYLRKISRISGHSFDYLQSQKKAFFLLKNVIRRISHDFPKLNVVIRPHPSETTLGWRDMCELPNVYVIKDEQLLPWLVAARILIHSGCTTAVEFALMGRCPVLYVGKNWDHVAVQTKKVSAIAENYEALFSYINNPPSLNNERKKFLSEIVTSFNKDKMASEEIIDLIYKLGKNDLDLKKRYLGIVLLLFRAFEHKLKGLFNKKFTEYQNQKFSDICEGEIRQRVAKITDIIGINSELIKVKQLNSNVICVTKMEES